MTLSILSRALGWGRLGSRGARKGPLGPFAVARERLWRLHDPTVGSTLSDEEILAAVDGFNAALRSNCTAAAEGLFVAVSPLCAQRESLVRPLMRRALLPLVYLGYERFDEVKQFVNWSLLKESAYIPHSEASRAWLANGLPGIPTLIQQLLDELHADATADERSHPKSPRA